MLPILTLKGSEERSIIVLNFSLISTKLSSIIGTENGTLVIPAGNEILYAVELSLSPIPVIFNQVELISRYLQ